MLTDFRDFKVFSIAIITVGMKEIRDLNGEFTIYPMSHRRLRPHKNDLWISNDRVMMMIADLFFFLVVLVNYANGINGRRTTYECVAVAHSNLFLLSYRCRIYLLSCIPSCFWLLCCLHSSFSQIGFFTWILAPHTRYGKMMSWAGVCGSCPRLIYPIHSRPKNDLWDGRWMDDKNNMFAFFGRSEAVFLKAQIDEEATGFAKSSLSASFNGFHLTTSQMTHCQPVNWEVSNNIAVRFRCHHHLP